MNKVSGGTPGFICIYFKRDEYPGLLIVFIARRRDKYHEQDQIRRTQKAASPIHVSQRLLNVNI